MRMYQSSDTIVMVRPSNFGFNIETASNNTFQKKDERDPEFIKIEAIEEFDRAVASLKSKGVDIIVWQDNPATIKTDAIFPNNWFSTHPDGTLLTYPMFSPNRRQERDTELIDYLKRNFIVKRDYSMTHYEEEGLFLEGTGSLILDHINKIVYACRSERTSVSLFDKWCVIMNYKGIYFEAKDENGVPIYHTNVMMALGTDIAIICLSAIHNPVEREKVLEALHQTDKKIIDISFEQMNDFAGNMIEIRGYQNQKFMVMSQTAFNSLQPKQIDIISRYAEPLAIKIPTIEKYGGGSARCMIAEIFLEKKY